MNNILKNCYIFNKMDNSQQQQAPNEKTPEVTVQATPLHDMIKLGFPSIERLESIISMNLKQYTGFWNYKVIGQSDSLEQLQRQFQHIEVRLFYAPEDITLYRVIAQKPEQPTIKPHPTVPGDGFVIYIDRNPELVVYVVKIDHYKANRKRPKGVVFKGIPSRIVPMDFLLNFTGMSLDDDDLSNPAPPDEPATTDVKK